ncbi:MauE/DoxX family redox-associated membrane protein [Paenibacillus sp. NPDC056579]|uniref:MauE/DoxX family redox-associated membrane protein n=1 Tax=Paenibacillus sp. NPDC056579 TaxID=3345871 RepID=UPI00367E74A0
MYWVLDIFLSMIFLLALYPKVINITDFVYEIKGYKVIPYKFERLAAYFAILTEFYLFFAYLTKITINARFIIAIGFLLILTLMQIKRRIVEKQNKCNCFGEFSLLNKYPLTRNIAILFLICLSRMFVETVNQFDWIYYIPILLIALLLYDLGVLMKGVRSASS